MLDLSDIIADIERSIKLPKNALDVFNELWPEFKFREWQEEHNSYLFNQLMENPDTVDMRVRLGVAGGHSIGKTFFDAVVAVMHIYYCWRYEPFRTYSGSIFSGRVAQLKTVLWREIQRLISASAVRFEKVTDTYIKIAPGFVIDAKTYDKNNPDAMMGSHAENQLIILDEASGIPDAIYEKIKTYTVNTRAVILATGNPYHLSGWFYSLWVNNVGWKLVNIARETDDDIFAREVRQQYGEGSDMERIMQYGQFPLSDKSSMFPTPMIENAIKRAPGFLDARDPCCFGIDISGGNSSDFSVLVVRSPRAVEEIIRVKMEPMKFAEHVISKCEELAKKDRLPVFIAIDAVAMGNPVWQYLREALKNKVRVHGINPGAKSDNKRFYNMRTSLMFELRDWLEEIGSLPNHKELIEELKMIELIRDKDSPTIKLVSKKDLGVVSPDVVDALSYSFCSKLFTLTNYY